jgi:hypothetical protein
MMLQYQKFHLQILSPISLQFEIILLTDIATLWKNLDLANVLEENFHCSM